MKLNRRIHIAALFLTAACFTASGVSVHATEVVEKVEVAGLCEHHTEHTAECLAQASCAHDHTSDCYQQIKKCVHVHGEGCYSGKATHAKCTHTCSRASGCITSTLNCHHEHNEDCCYVEGSACGYVCETCDGSKQAVIKESTGRHHSGRGHHGSHHSNHH